MTESSIWPLSDGILAQSLSQLQSYRPRVIGLDLYRDLPQPPGASALSAQLQAENLIAIANLIDGIPAPPSVAAARVGALLNDAMISSD